MTSLLETASPDVVQRSPRRLYLVLGAFAAVLILAAGFALGYLIPTLTRPGDNSADAGFARDMSVHHAQAVEMGMYAFRTSADQEIQILGYDIATTQQYQIGVMQSWLDEWHLSYSSSSPKMSWMTDGKSALLPDGRMPGMATTDELNKLKASTGKQFDILFCQLMLRHHLGGVHMADEAITLAKDSRVKTLAEAIKLGQQKEITQLTAKLKELGAQPLSS
jgi:uncharacterized protein (DUF305 family)